MPAPGVRKRAPLVAVAATAVAFLLLAFLAVRNAAVADRGRHPDRAETLWPTHPAVVTDRALLAIAKTAARGQAPPQSLNRDIRQIAVRAPLSPDPFLIKGAIAKTHGEGAAAEALLTEAKIRDPRSRGARYLLAERYFETGRMTAGLVEMQVLVGLQPQGASALVPALVDYAKTPGAVSQLREFFRHHQLTEAGVLSILAADPANADLVMSLATNSHNPEPDWRQVLVTQLAAAGQYDKAYDSWVRLTGAPPHRGLYNARFAALSPPPPFNWTYADTAEGVAEPGDQGALDVLYYGRVSAVLASQLMPVLPGSYRLGMKVAASDGETTAIRWKVRCLPGEAVLFELPLREGATSGTFTVAQTCKAARLELVGVAGDVPATTQLSISGLSLDAVAR